MGAGAKRPTAESAEYVVREATAADVSAIVDLYRDLSARSMLLRFSSLMSDRELTRAADLHPKDECVAAVAVSDGRFVGEARYVLWDGGAHELAMTIADEYQGQGLGKLLLGRLRTAALARGVTSLRAVVRVDNAAMLHMLEHIGVSIVRPPGCGDIVVDIACDDYMPGWGEVTGRPRVLVEARGTQEHPSTKALRDSGFDVRQCMGPGRNRGQACPVVALGRCRLFEEADLVAYLLPDTEDDCAEIGQLHTESHPARLVARSLDEWRLAAPALASSMPAARRPAGDEAQ